MDKKSKKMAKTCVKQGLLFWTNLENWCMLVKNLWKEKEGYCEE